MAIQQIRVPWAPGYDIGVGADLASGSPMNSPVKPEATPVDQASGATIDIQIQRINSTEELERALAVDVEASYGSASFGSGVSARFSFAKNSKVQSSSLFMTVTATVQLEFLSIDTPHLTDAAGAVIQHPELFEQRYGNMFVRGLGRGGLFVGVLRVDTGSSKESMNIASDLEGSYALFSGSAAEKFSKMQEEHKSEIFVRQYQEGGPKDLRITDISNPLQLLENANKFLDSFKAGSPEELAKVAVPYFVTLAPTTIAEGPAPLSPEEIQKAQDVLIYCARKRSALLDDLNLLEYISENHDKFTFTTPTTPETVREAARGFQEDLSLIADCAVAAINDRSSAKRPPQFAEERGQKYPTATMPTPMPTPVAPAETVEVPDFTSCRSKEDCDALAKTKNLTTSYVPTGTEEAFRVLYTIPDKGVPVPVGSAVEIHYPPQPVVIGPTVKDPSKLLWFANIILPDTRQ
jgi:hypothetical protein